VVRVRVVPTGAPDPIIAVDVVRLHPPNAWHTDQIDEEDRMSADYRLTRLGPSKTRVGLLITERWVVRQHPTRAEMARRATATWNRFARQIEERFRRGLPAKG